MTALKRFQRTCEAPPFQERAGMAWRRLRDTDEGQEPAFLTAGNTFLARIKEIVMSQVLRFASAIITTALVTGCFAPLGALDQNPVGFYLVAVDDCGNSAREAHLVDGRDAEIPSSLAPRASPEERTTSGGEEVVYRYSGLAPDQRYKLRLAYLSDHAGQAVKLSAGGVELQPQFEEPEHQAARHEIDI